MSILRKYNGLFTKTPAFAATRRLMLGLTFLTVPSAMFALNTNCTLIVPNNPLTATGLATPYQLVATNIADGPCNEKVKKQAAFVQAAIIDLSNGQISIYNPLVIDSGSTAAVAPVVPSLPLLRTVALWFGSNADGDLTLKGASATTLSSNDCHQGMGQFAYCNATAFFASAGFEILVHQLVPPPIGTGLDGRPCPTVRSFAAVDQDQSDNVTAGYLITPSGKLAQNTHANGLLFPGSTPLNNGSDNRLVDVFLDGAVSCHPWLAPDLANPGYPTPALALNEIQASLYQAAPVALIPLGDPFTLDPVTHLPSLAQVNLYRAGVGQLPAIFAGDADQTTYCSNLRSQARAALIADRPFYTGYATPDNTVAVDLFTFMVNRFNESYTNLKCDALLSLPSGVSVTKNGAGVVTSAIIF